MFPANLRYSGVSFAYQVSAVIGGGFAPFVMVLLLESTGTSLAVAGYLSSLAVLALICLALIGVNPAERPAGT
jgi:hypothetical protein